MFPLYRVDLHKPRLTAVTLQEGHEQPPRLKPLPVGAPAAASADPKWFSATRRENDAETRGIFRLPPPSGCAAASPRPTGVAPARYRHPAAPARPSPPAALVGVATAPPAPRPPSPPTLKR